MNLPVLIPAYNPNETLIDIVHEIIAQGVHHIIIINDGSKLETEHIFSQLEAINECHVLHHAVNLGKGRALKTGLNYCYLRFKDAPGIITADADGQHLVEDIIKVGKKFMENPKSLVIGTRTFEKGIPLRSFIGNIVTRYIFRFSTGLKISDTQSGLRCIPRTVVPDFIGIEGERYEYEMNMLICTKKISLNIVETGINTVYVDNNKSSHFNPLIDSMKIYFLLIRFSFSSIFASLIDFIIFAITYSVSADILISFIVARVISGTINFIVNRRLVFQSAENITGAVIKYCLLFLAIGSMAYLSIRTLAEFGINVLLAKILAETVLFLASFSIQRDYIFVKPKEEY
jgi:putative flippase GtrA